MIVYRLADHRFINDREGVGAKLFGGRWNEVNIPCIYASEYISLALLEKLVHAKGTENMVKVSLLKIEIPDDDQSLIKIDDQKLKENWIEDISYTQWIGGQMLGDYSIPAFSVPSAIIPTERNFILNPNSVNFKKIKFIETVNFYTDYRLLNMIL